MSTNDQQPTTLPDLPDTFTGSPVTAAGVEAIPGYHTSLWRDSPIGLREMKAQGILPAAADCPFITEAERRRLVVSPVHGYLLEGDLVVGVEKESHWHGRMAAKRRSAEEALTRLPIQPDHLEYATTKRLCTPMGADEK